MAYLKKNQLANILFPMVDGTDFASIESGITASDFNSAATKKFFGVNHGGSVAFTSGTISKATTLVRSGIFQQTLKATETNYDYLIFQFTHPSCADQIMVFQTVTNDDTDIMSQLSDIGSNLLSYMTGLSGMISDVDSQLLLNASMISDVQSALDSQFAVLLSNISDVDSQLLLNASMISDIQSALDSQFTWTSAFLSDMNSDLASQIGGITVTFGASDISDIASAVWANTIGARVDSRIVLIQSNVSDVESQVDLLATSNYLSQIHSDLTSQIGGVTATLTASDISDIASAVWANTIGARVDSRVALIQSNVSDVESAVDLLATSNYLSQVHSDLASRIGAITVSVTASDMSDIASRVWATAEGARVDSRVLLILSNLSDVESQIDAGIAITASSISDIASAVWGAKYTVHSAASSFGSLMSDIYSGVTAVDSQLLLNASMISDIDSQLLLNASMISDVQSALDSQFAVLLSNISDVESAVDLLATSNYLSQVHSDLASRIGGITVAIEASDISDIASAVWANTIGARVDSRIVLIQSNVSDVESQVDLLATSNYLSQIHSDLTSQIGGITAAIGASDISDIASAVWANAIGARVDSRIVLIQSNVSDVESQVDLLATSNYLSQIHSDLTSQIGGITVTVGASDISDIASAVWANAIGARVDSRVALIQSNVSDVESALDSQFTWTSAFLSDMNSDLASKIGNVSVALTASDISDIASAVAAAVTTVTASDISDIASAVWAYAIGARVDSRIVLIQSNVSDVESAVDLLATSNYLSQVHSDLASRIGGITVAIGASDISDIASAVWANTIGARVDSRIALIQSNVSDVESAVDLLATSNYLSQIHSDLTSQIGGLTFTVPASDMSDIASRVWATAEGARVDSRVLLIQSLVSDIDSQLLLNASTISDIQSALDSQFTWTSAFLSDMNSDLASQIGGVTVTFGASDISDIASAVWANTIGARVDSRVALIQSGVSDVESQLDLTHSLISDVESQVDLLATSNYLSQVHSDLASRIGGITAVIGASDISDIASAVWANAIGARVDSRVALIQSGVSDVDSQLTTTHATISGIYSLLSDVDSQLTVTYDLLSDVESQVDLLPTSNYLSQVHSDLASRIGGITASVSVSDMSDIASRVWANPTRTLTQAAASVTAAVTGSSITVYRGTTWSISLTGLGDISTYDTIYFSVKERLGDTDANAYLRVRNAVSGLERLNKAAPTAATNGTITIDNAITGAITITVQEEETVNMPLVSAFHYDVKGIDDNGSVNLVSVGSGQFTVAGDVTRAITS